MSVVRGAGVGGSAGIVLFRRGERCGWRFFIRGIVDSVCPLHHPTDCLDKYTDKKGLRSPDPIRRGQFIDCYLGEVIPKRTADVREDLAASTHEHSYLFGLDFLIDDDDIYVVDGQRLGSPARFMNHSCNPNCRMLPVSRTHGDERLYDIAFFSLRGIQANTELTFDYNPGAAAASGAGLKGGGDDGGAANGKGQKEKIDPSAVKCLCGEKNCRGQLWPNQRKGTK